MNTIFKKFNPKNYDEFVDKFSLSVPKGFNFAYDVIDKKAQETPQSVAMIHIDDEGKCNEYDYDFFSRNSSRIANVLQSKGLKKGDRAILILFRKVDFWISMLALHKIGAVAVPSPAMLTTKDIIYRVNYGNIKAAIVENSVTTNIEAARKECPGLEILFQVGGANTLKGWNDYAALCSVADDNFAKPDPCPGENDPLLIFFSSGTSGPPKMVEHVHTYPLGHAITALYWHDLKPSDVHLTLADTGWGKAMWGKFYGQWIADAVIFIYDFRGNFEPKNLLYFIEKYKVTSFCAPPTVYRFLIQEHLSAYDISKLRHCTTAGELLNQSVFHTWKKATGLSIYEGYGQTETTLQIATFPFMQPKPGSVGKPVPGWDIVLIDNDDHPCPPKVEGEICVNIKNKKPIGLFINYYNDPEKTAYTTRDGYYRTGDKAWMDEDGYYWFLGRMDDLIKSSGYRIGPYEVESALIMHEAVVEAAVTGLPDPVRGQLVKATVVLAEGYEPSAEMTQTLQDYVKVITAPYKYPRVISYVKELPKTISGKIKRAEIRAKDIALTKS